ncbi:hypothetical protein DFO77_10858 [Marinilabilia salmonicolor]|jgi:hypothetical protein|uniref:Uncharacterized protein n=2 Tax=Marinilabilia salmonicolor TaxID=989 RepID=A0A368V667_9BACT|nr:hypothetical protein DFO77_10858 [Marinilabilia salmonicolor]
MTPGEFNRNVNAGILCEGYVEGKGYAYIHYITPPLGSDYIVMCNAAPVQLQCLDVSDEAFQKSLLFADAAANSKSRNSSIPSSFIDADLKYEMDRYNRNHPPAGSTINENNEKEESLGLAKEILSLLRKIDAATQGSGDQAPSWMFNKGVFLTLTSSRGGSGPAIRASGPVKIRFVDVDTLPGLLGLSSARFGRSKYLKRNVNVLINVVKESTQFLHSLSKLAVFRTNLSKAWLSNKSAKEIAGWPDDIESAQVRGKSAMEMAVGVKIHQDSMDILYDFGSLRKKIRKPINGIAIDNKGDTIKLPGSGGRLLETIKK